MALFGTQRRLVGWFAYSPDKRERGHPEAPRDTSSQHLGMVVAPDTDVTAATRHPRDDLGPESRGLCDAGHRLDERFRRATTTAQLEGQDQIARGPFIGPRRQHPIHLGHGRDDLDRLGFGGAGRAECGSLTRADDTTGAERAGETCGDAHAPDGTGALGQV
jgi:hypothetical protein